jgi:ABC-2 type transport system permease protein
MKKTLRLIVIFLKLNLQKDMVYQLNALLNMIAVVTFIASFVLTMQLVTAKVPVIKGFSYDQLYIIIMLGQLWWYVTMMFVYKNFQHIADCINTGALDSYLIRPLNFRFLLPFFQFDFRHVLPTILVIVLIFLKINFFALTVNQIVGAIVFFSLGILITYSVTLLFTSFNFWTGRNNAIFSVLFELPDIVRLPVEFFPVIAQGIFVYAFPVILLVNPTFQILYGRYDVNLLVSTVIVAGVLFVASELIWVKGLKRYSSAN